MTLADYAHIFAKRWRVIAAAMILGALAAVAATVLMPRTYVATATNFVWISQVDGASASQRSQNALGQVGSYPALATSPYVLDPVIEKLGLKENSIELSKQLTVTNPVNTVNIVIEASSRSPQRSRDIANAVAEESGKLIERLVSPSATVGPSTSTSTSAENSPVKVSVAAPAVAPEGAASPRPLLNQGLGLTVGLAVGMVLAVRRERGRRPVQAKYAAREAEPVVPDRAPTTEQAPLDVFAAEDEEHEEYEEVEEDEDDVAATDEAAEARPGGQPVVG